MLITEVQIRRLEESLTKMRGIASVTLDRMIVIHDIKILYSGGNYFLAMPSKQTKVGTFKDVVHPINAMVREAFEKLVIGGYRKADENSYLKIDLIYTGADRQDLTEQILDDFTINGEKGQYSSSESKMSFKGSKPTVENESQISESLLKWLES